MFASFYLVCKDREQAAGIKAGRSVATALAVCDTHSEAQRFAVSWYTEYPEIDVWAVLVDQHVPDREVLRRVGWFHTEQMEDASMFAGIGGRA